MILLALPDFSPKMRKIYQKLNKVHDRKWQSSCYNTRQS
ncbi:hypothetical protein GW12_26190 [Acinetobacter sp. HR7]|nr:hypothetical protein GW12_26190 [Acinetobacter sp. HR7]